MVRSTQRQIEDAQREIAAAFTALPDNYMDCRDPGIRHSWEKVTDFHVIPAEQVGRKLANLGRTETCQRCGTTKMEMFILIDGRIRKVGQRMDYAEGYLLTGTGVPRGVKRSEVVWSENYRRAMEAAADNLNGKAKPKGRTTKSRGRR